MTTTKKTLKEYAEDAAARLKKLQNGSTQLKKEKLKSPKPPVNVQRNVKRPQGRGR